MGFAKNILKEHSNDTLHTNWNNSIGQKWTVKKLYYTKNMFLIYSVYAYKCLYDLSPIKNSALNIYFSHNIKSYVEGN